MRKKIEQQLKLGAISIAEVKIPLKSREELPPILMALQYLYVDDRKLLFPVRYSV